MVFLSQKTKERILLLINLATAKDLAKDYYVVNEEGELIDIPEMAIKSLFKKKYRDGESALRKLEYTSQQIQDYFNKIKALNFRIGKLMYDRIIFIVATINNEKLFFINNKLADHMSDDAAKEGFYINPQSVIQKAKESYEKACGKLDEAIKRSKNMLKETKKLVRLTESDIHGMIRESVSHIISEMANPLGSRKKTLYNHLYRAANAVTHGNFHDDNWEGVRSVQEAIQDACDAFSDKFGTPQIDADFWCEDGGYRSANDSHWKQWEISISMNGQEIFGGNMKAFAHGSMDGAFDGNAFDYYDVVVSFY